MTPSPANEPGDGPDNEDAVDLRDAGPGRASPKERADADPERTCVATGQRLPQSRMIRFVRAPDGSAVPDVAGRLPGRGVWVTATREALEAAIAKKGFTRGLRAQVEIPPGLSDMVEALLVKRCQDLLGLAKRAGDIVLGHDQVAEEIRRRSPGWLLEASDGSDDGRMKVLKLAWALYEDVRVAGALSATELGMAFGRAHVIHGVIKRGRFAKQWARAYGRLCGFRVRPEENWFSGRDR